MLSRTVLTFIERAVKGKTSVAAAQSARVARKGLRGNGASLNLSSIRFGGGVAFHPERGNQQEQEKEAQRHSLRRSLKSSPAPIVSDTPGSGYSGNIRSYETPRGEAARRPEDDRENLASSSPTFHSSTSYGMIDTEEMVEHRESETIFDAGEVSGEMEVELMGKGDRHVGPSGRHLVQVKQYVRSNQEEGNGRDEERNLVEGDSSSEFSLENSTDGVRSRQTVSFQNAPLEKPMRRAGGHHPYASDASDGGGSTLHQNIRNFQSGRKKKKEESEEELQEVISRGGTTPGTHSGRTSSGCETSLPASSSLGFHYSSEHTPSSFTSPLEDNSSHLTGEDTADRNELPLSSASPPTDHNRESGKNEGIEEGEHDNKSHVYSPTDSSSLVVSASPQHSSSTSPLSSFNPIRTAEVGSADGASLLCSRTNGGADKGISGGGGKSVEAYRFLLHHIDAEIAALKRRHTSVTSHRVQLEEQQASRIRELYNFMESPWLLLKTAHPPPLPATGMEVFLKEQSILKRESSNNNSDSTHSTPSNGNSPSVGGSSSAPLDLSREKMFVLACQKNYRSLPHAEKRIYEEAAKFNAALREEMKQRLSSGCSFFEGFCEQIQECTPSMVREGRLPAPPPGTPANFLTRGSTESSEHVSPSPMAMTRRTAGITRNSKFFRRGAINRGMPALAAAAITTTSPSERSGESGKGKTISSSFTTPVARVMSRGLMRVQHRPVLDPPTSPNMHGALRGGGGGGGGASHPSSVGRPSHSHPHEKEGVAIGAGSRGNISSLKALQSGKSILHYSSLSSKKGVASPTTASIAGRQDSNGRNSALTSIRQRGTMVTSLPRGGGGTKSIIGKETPPSFKMEKHSSFRHRASSSELLSNTTTSSSSAITHPQRKKHLKGKSAAKMLLKASHPKKKIKKEGGRSKTLTQKNSPATSNARKKGITKGSRKLKCSQKHLPGAGASSSTSAASQTSRGGEKAKKKHNNKQRKIKLAGSPRALASSQKKGASPRVGGHKVGEAHKDEKGHRAGHGSAFSSSSPRKTSVTSSSSCSRTSRSMTSPSLSSSNTPRSLVNRFNSPTMGSVLVINEHRSPSLPLPQVTPRIPVGRRATGKKRKPLSNKRT